MTWLLDLDGVVWLSGRGIEGSAAAVTRLREGGQRVVFFTNNSGPTMAEHLRALAGAGVEAQAEDVLTSAQAAASVLPPGSRAAVLGGEGIREALAERGVTVVATEDSPDAVVVGRTTDLAYEELAAAASAIRGGAQFVATNSDATMPTPDGPVPGAGAIVAFLQVASGREPLIAGKPSSHSAALVADRVGPVEISVGDRPETDGLFALATRSRFALVLSGVTTDEDLPVHPTPQLISPNLAAVVDEVLGR